MSQAIRDDSDNSLNMPITSTHDIIARLNKSGFNNDWVCLGSVDTEVFIEGVGNIWNRARSEKEMLQHVILYQNNLNEFNNLYISSLIGAVTDDEFDESAKDFEVTYDSDIDDEELEYKIAILRSVTPISFSTTEIADVLRVEKKRVEKICLSIEASEE